MEEVRELFDSFDIDKDGKLSLAELIQAFKRDKQNVDIKELEADFKKYDTDGDGFLDFDEFTILAADKFGDS